MGQGQGGGAWGHSHCHHQEPNQPQPSHKYKAMGKRGCVHMQVQMSAKANVCLSHVHPKYTQIIHNNKLSLRCARGKGVRQASGGQAGGKGNKAGGRGQGWVRGSGWVGWEAGVGQAGTARPPGNCHNTTHHHHHHCPGGVGGWSGG